MQSSSKKKARINKLSITIRPSTPYNEYQLDNYKNTDWLINNSYKKDLDINVFNGVLIDNYICYDPDFKAFEKANFDYKTIHTSNESKFEYLIILETYVNSQTSVHRLIYTNDISWVNKVCSILESE